MNRTDIITNIITAQDKAHTEARAYKNDTSKRYNYWRALATATTYDQTLAMFKRQTEHKIPNKAATARADYEHARHNNTPETTLAIKHGHRDALATVTEWMNNQ